MIVVISIIDIIIVLINCIVSYSLYKRNKNQIQKKYFYLVFILSAITISVSIYNIFK